MIIDRGEGTLFNGHLYNWIDRDEGTNFNWHLYIKKTGMRGLILMGIYTTG